MHVSVTGSSTSLSQPLRSPKDFLSAMADGFPLSVSVFTYGVAYGALAHTSNHLSFLQTISMSAFLFAGASQFAFLALLQQGAVMAAVVGSIFLLNSRQILYGLSLGPYMRHISWRSLWFLSHGLTDESYSVSIIAAQKRPISAWYFAGAGCAVFLPWQLASSLGYALGGYITHPEQFGLDFAYIGAFMGLFIAQWTSPSRILAGVISLIGSVAASLWFGTTGAVLAGAVLAFVCGILVPLNHSTESEVTFQ